MSIIKLFNNYSIEIREDGFFNATQMCKVFSKLPKDYLKSESTKAFLEALQRQKDFCPTDLVQVVNGGLQSGTWVQKLVAIDLARWLSPEFHVQVIEWSEEVMSGNRPSLPEITDEESYSNQLVEMFARTSQPLQKEIIVKNTASEEPPTRRIDLKVYGKNIYYEVKMHTITMSDVKEIMFNRKYHNILSELHAGDYKLYLVSPKGIAEEPRCYLKEMNNVDFIHGEELALHAAYLLLKDDVAKTQVMKHILPSYSHLLPPNWRQAIIQDGEPVVLPPSKDDSLIYNAELPLGVILHKNYDTHKRYRTRFQHKGKMYSVGYYTCPLEAGQAVKQKMLEIKGFYGVYAA